VQPNQLYDLEVSLYFALNLKALCSVLLQAIYPLQPHETVCSDKRVREKKRTQNVLPERPGKESVKLPGMFLEVCGGRDDAGERIAARKHIGGDVLLTGSCGGDARTHRAM
jgi:hypothetical protein